MSKIGCISDMHYDLTCSILNGVGSKYNYSQRLDNLVESYGWAMQVFSDNDCRVVINFGDMVNSDILLPEVNSAIYKSLEYWDKLKNKMPQLYLLGNHELKDKNRNFTSIDMAQGFSKFDIYRNMEVATIGDVSYLMIPFDADDNYDEVYTILDTLKDEGKKVVICSHTFYTNLDYLNTTDATKTYRVNSGIDFDKIRQYKNVQSIFNGHIHYGWDYENFYHQVGILSGISFSDYYGYCKPGVLIYDDETNTVERFENPNAVLFIKKKINDLQELNSLDNFNGKVIYRIDCNLDIKEDVKSYLDELVESNEDILNYSIKGESQTNQVSTQEISKVELNSYKSPYQALLDFINSEEELPYDKRELERYLNEYIR